MEDGFDLNRLCRRRGEKNCLERDFVAPSRSGARGVFVSLSIEHRSSNIEHGDEGGGNEGTPEQERAEKSTEGQGVAKHSTKSL